MSFSSLSPETKSLEFTFQPTRFALYKLDELFITIYVTVYKILDSVKYYAVSF